MTTALSPIAAFALFVAVFLGSCIFLRVNVAFGVGLGCIMVLIFGKYANTFFLQSAFSSMDSFPFLAVPTFILAGVLMEHSGISEKLVNWCQALAGRVRGSIGAVATLACMAFGLLCGSATATLSAIGKMMITEMNRHGYKKDYAAALVASTCFLGILIPPSTPGIVYALAANISITDIWMSTIVPAILIGFGTIFINWFVQGRTEEKLPRQEHAFAAYTTNLGKQTLKSIPSLIMPVIVFGGIYGGIFTPTEAGAVCCVYGIIFFLYQFFKNRGQGKNLKDIFVEAATGTASIGILIGLSLCAGRIITMCGVSTVLTNWMLAHVSSKCTFLLLYNVVLVIFGMFMNQNATILILTPLLLPTAQAYGLTPLDFGAIMMVANCYGGLTPPFATYNFIASGLSGESFASVTKKTLPFLAWGYAVIFLMCVWPQLYSWLPNLING